MMTMFDKIWWKYKNIYDNDEEYNIYDNDDMLMMVVMIIKDPVCCN
jgi:hypothetical protein